MVYWRIKYNYFISSVVKNVDFLKHNFIITIKVVCTYPCLVQARGARCSSVVRAFAHGAMDRRIDPSCGEPIELFLVPASAPRLV